MADLYTTLVRAKEALRGEPAPLTPLTAEALRHVDPAFVPGLGILEEDEDRGLRCPIRGCGKFKHHLDTHVRSHGLDADVFRRVLSLDPRAPLRSERVRAEHAQTLADGKARRLAQAALKQAVDRRSDMLPQYERASWEVVCAIDNEEWECSMRQWGEEWQLHHRRAYELGCWLFADAENEGYDAARIETIAWLAVGLSVSQQQADAEYEAPGRATRTDAQREGAVKKRRQTIRERSGRDRALSAGLRNLFNLCDAQLSQRVLAVRDKVRRWPGLRDAQEHDPKLVGALLLLEWEWEHVIAWTRLRVGDYKDGGRAAVCILLNAWANVNGRLPSETDLRRSTPLLPPKKTILKALRAKAWRDAMENVQAATSLAEAAD